MKSTIVLAEEGRNHLLEGPLGAVASQEDAERLLTALAAEFPHVPFRIELTEELLENVEWLAINDLARKSCP